MTPDPSQPRKASPEAVAKVMEAMGCKSDGSPWPYEPECFQHGDVWTDRGCPVAVAAADAAIGQDALTIAAEGKRLRAVILGLADEWFHINPAHLIHRGDAAKELRARADEVQP